MQRLNAWLLLGLSLALICVSPSFGRGVRFAHITDAHLLDSEGKPRDSRPENERGLRWAIDEINRRNVAGPAFEFVVFTGDFGLEAALKSKLKELNINVEGLKLDDELQAVLKMRHAELDQEIDRAAEEFQVFLERSHVRTWIMVPGNNDLIDERPFTIEFFHTFLVKLQEKVGASKRILTFPTELHS